MYVDRERTVIVSHFIVKLNRSDSIRETQGDLMNVSSSTFIIQQEAQNVKIVSLKSLTFKACFYEMDVLNGN